MTAGVIGIVFPCVAGAQIGNDVTYVFIGVFKQHTNNVEDPAPMFEVEVTICGTGLPQVTVTPPGESPALLVAEGASCWVDETELLLSSPPIGTFEFSFEGTPEIVEVLYDPLQPSCHAQVSTPSPGGSGVSLQPIFGWASVDGCADTGIEVFVDGPDRDEDPGGFLALSQTSWNPWTPGDELSAGTQYVFNINVSSRDTPDASPHAFFYETDFAYNNDVLFTTPEPGFLGGLFAGMIGLGFLRWRPRSKEE